MKNFPYLCISLKTVDMRTFLLALALTISFAACGGSDDGDDTDIDTTTDSSSTDSTGDSSDSSSDDSSTSAATFAKGADLSWVTEMEADGKTFYNSSGTATDCFELMASIGMNACRLRVWVNPENDYGAYCDKADVVAKAVRAKAAGMDVMIDFHYSDMFADPSRQNTPAAWEDYSLTEMASAVASHTTEVLNAVVAAGVTPRWVQVGNETRNGMIWPTGQLWTDDGDIADGWSNYATLSNAGYDAVKAVLPDAIVIIHINNAWADNDWWFTKFKAAGGKMDMIGLSHYPQSESDKTYSEVNSLAIEHIQSLASTYGVKVMITEVGVKSSNETLASTVLNAFITSAKALDECAGVFYWEPQVYGSWKPAIYTTWGWSAYDMGAFTSAGKPAACLSAFE